jgi:hypothetical protein
VKSEILFSWAEIILYTFVGADTFQAVESIDYRGEDGRLPVCVNHVTFSNFRLLSSSETAVNPGNKKLKNHLLIRLDVKNSLGSFISQKREGRRYGSIYLFRTSL